jgi:hypothetical protein
MKNAKLIKVPYFLFITGFVFFQTTQLWRPEYFSNPIAHYFADQFSIFGFFFPWILGMGLRYYFRPYWNSVSSAPLKHADPIFISRTFLGACIIGVLGFIILPSRENPLLFLMTGTLSTLLILRWLNKWILIWLAFLSLCTQAANFLDLFSLDPFILTFLSFLSWMLLGFSVSHLLLEAKTEWRPLSLLFKKGWSKYHPIEAFSSGAVPILLVQLSLFRELALEIELEQRSAWICIALMSAQFYASYALGIGFIFLKEGRFTRFSKAFLSRLNQILDKQL